MRLSRSKGKFSAARNFIAASCLSVLVSACVSSDPVRDVCPPPIWMDNKVADELTNIPFVGYEDLWSWLARIERLNEALEACHG